MRPGEVSTDKQAFEQVLKALEGDVGAILKLVALAREKGLYWVGNEAPYWALVRMMFPITEALADLAYQDEETSQQLIKVLANEFEAVRPGPHRYKGKAAILTILFRHSLTHTDEMRTLTSAGRKVGWALSVGMQADHLRVTQHGPRTFSVHFDITAFYDDIVAVCKNAINKPENGSVAQRYNGWLGLDLDAKKTKQHSPVGLAKKEIAVL